MSITGKWLAAHDLECGEHAAGASSSDLTPRDHEGVLEGRATCTAPSIGACIMDVQGPMPPLPSSTWWPSRFCESSKKPKATGLARCAASPQSRDSQMALQIAWLGSQALHAASQASPLSGSCKATSPPTPRQPAQGMRVHLQHLPDR